MNKNKDIWPEWIKPYKGIIYFVIILLVSHFFWKFTVQGDESNTLVTFFGLDITAPFAYMARHFAYMTEKVLHFFGSDVMLAKDNILYYSNGNGVRIVWACTGIKQAYIFFCIIAFTRGPWLKKLWYIPSGIIVIYLFNLLRMVVIIGLAKNHMEWFDILHNYIFKYLFYGVIFLMWVIWDEKIATRKHSENQKTIES